ncbi:NERD domain-containing protein [Undibacterium curvum]|uniref:NERD domain-containing protein n=1 Tax=Undibacterium curvum TaxID=2762294 RepID=A0ABR7A107_9BURK|nr:NERD domain-containing protein/DEAD/DEAH box helicase [Undibacterium curvum]MBC3930600.1 NERD domain-containing protein [Undibacterium curvum]
MVALLPDLSEQVKKTIGYRRELDVLELLQRALPDEYCIFHNIEWQSLQKEKDSHGEVDFIVMNQAGDLLLIEVKAGAVNIINGKITKDYKQNRRDVVVQIHTQYGAMRQLLSKENLNVHVQTCLVLPDFRVTESAIVGLPRERIFDSVDFPNLPARIIKLLPPGTKDKNASNVKAFLSNHLDLVPDVATIQGQLLQTIRGLSDGLATWVPRIKAPTQRYRIQATAGSGKTQLALSLLNEVAGSGLRSLYVCFNRPLAEHMCRIAPGQCTTFHTMCIDRYRQGGQIIDFRDVDIFSKATQHFLNCAPLDQELVDLLILDEAQDLQPEWINHLLNFLRPDGRLYLLEDADQCLYARKSCELSETVSIECMDNFRSPQMICQAINAFGLTSKSIKSKSPWHGDIPQFYIYDGGEHDLIKKTEGAIQDCLKQGIDVTDIAVLTVKGMQQSKVLRQENLASYSTKRFTGDFSEDGQAKWSKGLLLLESVFRFKGQSAAAIILTEVDFAELSKAERAKLFVGMTRGTLSVSIVLTQRASDLLVQEMCAH